MNRSALGTTACCVLAAIAGYLLASGGTGGAWNDRRENGAEGEGWKSPWGRRAPSIPAPVKKGRTPEELASLKHGLQERFARCACAKNDWVLRQQAAVVLASFSTGELAQFAKELSPQGKSAMLDHVSEWRRTLTREIFRQWGLKDPAGACLAAARSGWAPGTAVFDDWLRRDPKAAGEWLADGNFPAGSVDAVAKLKESFLNHQALTDFPSARGSLGRLDPEMQKKTLLDWSQRLAHDPARRDELFDLLASRGDPDFTRKCLQEMVREMALKSPWNASVFVESSDFPEEQKQVLSEQVLGEWAVKDPQQAFARWAELKDDEVPAPLFRAMDGWSLNSPGKEQAIEWVTKLDPGPAREKFKANLITSLSRGERYGQAAELSATLDDPVERLRQMKTVKRQWEEKYPKYAKDWFATLSPEDRDALTGR